jgi:predicted nucleic acid-binding protein
VNAVLIDSDILIEVLRGRDSAILQRWEEFAGGDTATVCSPVTIAEIWCGTRPEEIEAVERLFASLPTVPAGTEIGRRAGEFLARYGKSHGVELGDALIGATAMVHGLGLWTRNRKHYPMSGIGFY